MASNGITARRSFHRIWIAGKKTLVKRAPGMNTVLYEAYQYRYSAKFLLFVCIYVLISYGYPVNFK